MSLKPLRVATNAAPKAKSSDIPIIEVEGDLVTQYNLAAVEKKNAEAKLATEGEKIKKEGLPKLYELAIANPDTPPSSIKLQDKFGATVLVIQQDRYSEFDPEVAGQVFEALGAEISDFAQFVVKAKFDDEVFLAAANTDAGDEGVFSSKIYNAYKQAIDRVTAQLIRDGLLPAGALSPLSSRQAAMTKPDFHKARWKAFPDVAQQQQLATVVPAVVALKPIIEADATAANGEKAPKSATKRALATARAG